MRALRARCRRGCSLWVKGGGRVLPGLERRRAAEAELFMSETPPQAGRGVTGAPKSVAIDRRIGGAGAVIGGATAVAVAGMLPTWIAVAIIAAAGLGLAAWAYLDGAGPRSGGGVMLPVAMAAQLALGLVQGPLGKILEAYVVRRRAAAQARRRDRDSRRWPISPAAPSWGPAW